MAAHDSVARFGLGKIAADGFGKFRPNGFFRDDCQEALCDGEFLFWKRVDKFVEDVAADHDDSIRSLLWSISRKESIARCKSRPHPQVARCRAIDIRFWVRSHMGVGRFPRRLILVIGLTTIWTELELPTTGLVDRMRIADPRLWPLLVNVARVRPIVQYPPEPGHIPVTLPNWLRVIPLSAGNEPCRQ